MPEREPCVPEGTDAFVARIGIDWADRKHDIALQADGAGTVEYSVIEHSPNGIDDWVQSLRLRFDGPIAVAIEQSRGALINALAQYEFITIFPIPPARLASFRSSMSSSGARNDPSDARMILEYLVKHADRIVPWAPDDEQTRTLDLLCRNRRTLVDHRTTISNMLRDALKQYYPQACEWFAVLYTREACDFLLRWNTLDRAKRARPNSIRKFLIDHHDRNPERIERIIESVASARPLTTDAAILEATSMMVTALTKQLKDLTASIAKIDARIDDVLAQHPDAPIFTSLPGAGAALAPRLLAALGSDRTRFTDAAQIQTYSGIAPVTIKSGATTNRIHRRYACPKYMRQTFHEFADHSRRQCAWARAYYEQMRQRGSKHHAAVRSLAFKWIRIIYACWRAREPYDDARYVAALRAHGSPIATRIP